MLCCAEVKGDESSQSDPVSASLEHCRLAKTHKLEMHSFSSRPLDVKSLKFFCTDCGKSSLGDDRGRQEIELDTPRGSETCMQGQFIVQTRQI